MKTQRLAKRAATRTASALDAHPPSPRRDTRRQATRRAYREELVDAAPKRRSVLALQSMQLDFPFLATPIERRERQHEGIALLARRPLLVGPIHRFAPAPPGQTRGLSKRLRPLRALADMAEWIGEFCFQKLQDLLPQRLVADLPDAELPDQKRQKDVRLEVDVVGERLALTCEILFPKP